jgi:hypothetical protein
LCKELYADAGVIVEKFNWWKIIYYNIKYYNIYYNGIL